MGNHRKTFRSARPLAAAVAGLALVAGLLAPGAGSTELAPGAPAPAPAASVATDAASVAADAAAAAAAADPDQDATTTTAPDDTVDTSTILGSDTAPGPADEPVWNAKSFRAGYMVSDQKFFDANGSDQARLQAVMNSEGAGCTGALCLKGYTLSTPNKAADAYCGAYVGAANEPAARIVNKVGKACGINPMLLLVLVQKESGLVSDPSPSQAQYQRATGWNCPDTPAGCDPKYAGFFTQVYGAAWQFQVYGTGSSGVSNYKPGTTATIAYNPVASCGSSAVSIRNQATANLYNYTPYQPNQYALTGEPVSQKSCATYGNLNVWGLLSDWTGSLANAGAAPVGGLDTPGFGGGQLKLSGWAIDPTSQGVGLAVKLVVTRPDGSTTAKTVTANANRAGLPAAYPVAGSSHGFSMTVPATQSGNYTVCATVVGVDWNTAADTALPCATTGFYSAPAATVVASSRLAGEGRYETAVAISKSAFTPGVPVAYVATGVNFPDALAAAPAAAATGGPLLLVQPNGVPAVVSAELARLKPAKIIVVGGTAAVDASTFSALSAIQRNTVRIAGDDRYDTSRRIIADAFPGGSKTAYVATGANFPDALGASAAAGAAKAPVVLVDGTAASVDQPTSALLRKLGVTSATLAGDVGVLSAGIATTLKASGVTVTRAAGTDRYDTSEKINWAAFSTTGAATVYFATGTSYPDALAGAAVAGGTKSPLFVVPSSCVPAAVIADVVSFEARKVVLLGGTATLQPAVGALTRC